MPTVNGTTLAGQPDTGDVINVINVDNNALKDVSQAQNVPGGFGDEADDVSTGSASAMRRSATRKKRM
jgi:hypothetical protein